MRIGDAATIGHWASQIPRHSAWVFSQIEPYLEPPVIEIGAGTGLLSEHIAAAIPGGSIFVEPFLYPGDRAGQARRRWVRGGTEGLRTASCRSLVSKCVLEHIEDDAAELREWHRVLETGGTLVLWVPAGPHLYGTLDAGLGHFRRYRLAEIKNKLEIAGFRIRHHRHVERLAGAGWWFTGSVLRRQSPSALGLSFYDRILPALVGWERLPGLRSIPFGASLLVVADAT